jgi:hypothetical protein
MIDAELRNQGIGKLRLQLLCPEFGEDYWRHHNRLIFEAHVHEMNIKAGKVGDPGLMPAQIRLVFSHFVNVD